VVKRRGGSAPASRSSSGPADAAALPFADASFDAVVCQFGLMFFPDKPKSFSEVHRVPAGSLGIWVDSNYLQA
jgi:hypothetical protein